MPLPLTVSCSNKIQIGFTFLVPAHPGSPGKRAVKRVCVCVHYLLRSNAQRMCEWRFVVVIITHIIIMMIGVSSLSLAE